MRLRPAWQSKGDQMKGSRGKAQRQPTQCTEVQVQMRVWCRSRCVCPGAGVRCGSKRALGAGSGANAVQGKGQVSPPAGRQDSRANDFKANRVELHMALWHKQRRSCAPEHLSIGPLLMWLHQPP